MELMVVPRPIPTLIYYCRSQMLQHMTIVLAFDSNNGSDLRQPVSFCNISEFGLPEEVLLKHRPKKTTFCQNPVDIATDLAVVQLAILLRFIHHRYNVILVCWNEDPGERPTFTELLSKLEDLIPKYVNLAAKHQSSSDLDKINPITASEYDCSIVPPEEDSLLNTILTRISGGNRRGPRSQFQDLEESFLSVNYYYSEYYMEMKPAPLAVTAETHPPSEVNSAATSATERMQNVSSRFSTNVTDTTFDSGYVHMDPQPAKTN